MLDLAIGSSGNSNFNFYNFHAFDGSGMIDNGKFLRINCYKTREPAALVFPPV